MFSTELDPEETAGYLRHHLALAGRSDTLFSDGTAALLMAITDETSRPRLSARCLGPEEPGSGRI